jgi:hypothetical protein
LAGGISWWLKAMNDVTRILTDIEQGDGQAAEQLLPLVYDELRKLAAARMAAENPGHTLNATALVHEAYLRLVDDQHFDDCRHFFAAAAEAMQRILVDHARDRKRLKRAGGDGSSYSIRSVPSRRIPTSSCRWMNCSPGSGRRTRLRRGSLSSTCSPGFPSRRRARR